ncbi:hypothetical protein CVIRNUC_010100 [Coccomyxa viridis]|uniref:Non-haem dioxygenase N-terminal domain-containing protein n=1 Tax=Coccomyxa viridis TaxID=1274662 RepID=A0AAV1IHR6_9CHLO|nr:hypothetical protein CVIRNUC_010100 [Coccomyxa viridis]
MNVGPPTVDLRDFQGRKHSILDDLMSAAISKGFFYISNHGITQQLIDRAFACSTQYFQQPTEVKAAFPTTDWSTLDLLGYKAYRMQEGGQTIWPT